MSQACIGCHNATPPQP